MTKLSQVNKVLIQKINVYTPDIQFNENSHEKQLEVELSLRRRSELLNIF